MRPIGIVVYSVGITKSRIEYGSGLFLYLWKCEMMIRHGSWWKVRISRVLLKNRTICDSTWWMRHWNGGMWNDARFSICMSSTNFHFFLRNSYFWCVLYFVVRMFFFGYSPCCVAMSYFCVFPVSIVRNRGVKENGTLVRTGCLCGWICMFAWWKSKNFSRVIGNSYILECQSDGCISVRRWMHGTGMFWFWNCTNHDNVMLEL